MFQDSKLGYYIYSTLNLKRGCTSIPNDIPEHPTQPESTYLSKLQTTLNTKIFNGQRHPQSTYQSFVNEFLINTTRVQFCERNGETLGKSEFRDYLFKRYADVKAYTVSLKI